MMMVLLLACAAARVKFDRKLAPLVVLITLWLVGAGASLIRSATTPARSFIS